MLKRIVGVIVGISVAVLLGCPPNPVTPPAITCGPNDAGQCSGTCPANQTCAQTSPTICACTGDAGSPFCAFNSAHVCGGPCPEGQSCQQKGATICACYPSG